MLYFAYGSNMSSIRLRHRVPSAAQVTVATLLNHDLRFHKIGTDGSAKCDAFDTGDCEHSVIGVVFRLAEAEKPLLDKIESLGSGYEQKSVEVVSASGKSIEAITYYAIHIDPALKPFHWYKHHVLVGARENDLPQSYVERISMVASIPDPDPQQHEKEMGIYQ